MGRSFCSQILRNSLEKAKMHAVSRVEQALKELRSGVEEDVPKGSSLTRYKRQWVVEDGEDEEYLQSSGDSELGGTQ